MSVDSRRSETLSRDVSMDRVLRDANTAAYDNEQLHSLFVKLPSEIRNRVYRYILVVEVKCFSCEWQYKSWERSWNAKGLNVLNACKKIRAETLPWLHLTVSLRPFQEMTPYSCHLHALNYIRLEIIRFAGAPISALSFYAWEVQSRAPYCPHCGTCMASLAVVTNYTEQLCNEHEHVEDGVTKRTCDSCCGFLKLRGDFSIQKQTWSKMLAMSKSLDEMYWGWRNDPPR